MPRDFADRALLKRGKHGALIPRSPASGSSLPGGSVTHRRGRRQLREAMQEGRPILVRESDGVAIRPAHFEEVLKAHRSPNGVVTVPDVLSSDGIHYGCDCVIRTERSEHKAVKFDPTPRLVKKKKN